VTASESLKALDAAVRASLELIGEGDWTPQDSLLASVPLPALIALTEAAEREGSGVAVIRALGFVGNSHYCADCLNTFHDDCGQHKPNCARLAAMLADEEWPDLTPFRALAALETELEGERQ